MEKPKRKQIRLEGYDYSQNNAYFITICSRKKQKLFWNTENPTLTFENELLPLSNIGLIIQESIGKIPYVYPNVEIDIFTIMPNHLHMIICITENRGRATVSTIINQLKGAITKQVGHSIWQKSFYDRIIRNDEEYQRIRDYIYFNPANWIDDTKYGS
ncbi:MAG: transposase [Bellilinea sp.]